ncbi:hypothetical protein EDD27_2161 [Nonomuraea polychroma]|uniref:Cytochrome C biogenesis DsbD-like protein n=1 Tax=Nonomuraea polychroma TaxID=46176 RepID=A0A438M2S5_9ACTN|nr:hypothetical protein [Nonomuraea polychroma]RVX39788.1 hypothetical protein EDD27_2161 [Nonomuraea polychroma]
MTTVVPPVQSQPTEQQTPRRRWLVVTLSVVAGFLLTVVWSAHFVDQTIGHTVADGLLGHDANEVPIAGVSAGLIFAFVTGLAGTFTACNIAAFGALAPLLSDQRTMRGRLAAALRPLAHLAAGMVVVSALYGAVVAIVGTSMPQFSTATATGLTPRSVQSMVTFGIIGIVMIYLGLAALGIVRDPLARVSRRYPHARMALMGALIGAFLIGRPYGLFRQLFRDAAESHNVLYGVFAFVLQSIGNIIIISTLFLGMALLPGGKMNRWMTAKPGRMAVVMGAAFIVAGVFTLLYWDVRLLARRGYIWYPIAPWAA